MSARSDAFFDEIDDVALGHDCAYSVRVHTLIPGQLSTYACAECVDEVKAIALRHLPTATDVVVSPLPSPPAVKESNP